MIDIETDIFNEVASMLLEKHPLTFMTGEYVASPAAFPCVSLMEMDNTAYRRTQSSYSGENHAEVMYEINVYSNSASMRKEECKTIAADIDEVMIGMGFTRIMLNPVPNMLDASVYRITARYSAVISKDLTIYRR